MKLDEGEAEAIALCREQKGLRKMAKIQALTHEVKVKMANSQFDFLEKRVMELGLTSKAELLRLYIANDMMKTEQSHTKKRRFSMEGIFKDGKVTDEDLDEVKHIWDSRELQ